MLPRFTQIDTDEDKISRTSLSKGVLPRWATMAEEMTPLKPGRIVARSWRMSHWKSVSMRKSIHGIRTPGLVQCQPLRAACSGSFLWYNWLSGNKFG